MKKILKFVSICAACIMLTNAGMAATRNANNAKGRTATTTVARTADNTSRAVSVRGTSVRGATPTVTARETAPVITPKASRAATTRAATSQRVVGISERASKNRGVRAVVGTRASRARAASAEATAIATAVSGTDAATKSTAADKDSGATKMADTKTGAEYERCKSAYFECMDQFCKLKNDDYRRCSCSDRVYELDEIRDTLADAGQQLTEFNENLDAVGMTYEQALAMRSPSEGENAMTEDESASKALLQAIMNSIRGEDTNVGGKYSGMNSVNLAFDTANAFGMQDAGQFIATYNGQNLYSAVYPQCRDAVAADCNNASLQRAVTAYLMAVEQDCNTVQTAMKNQTKKVKSAIRESSAMLDLARVENRKKHNSDDITTCVNNVEAAILSEEVCGADYHKCLDNGEFIDVATGKPIAGVERFYELEHLLTFRDGVDAVDQKLSKISSNMTFVNNFQRRVKQFAEPALDKCTEMADAVWEEYLDKALLSIYYAQKAKVAEIKEGCFDFVSSCYMDGDKSLTAAMEALASDSTVLLQPDKIKLTSIMCTEYIGSCNNMFDGDIIAQYIDTHTQTDVTAACRAVAKQCFDGFGGAGYGNFYYPYSGQFVTGRALDWFTLYEYIGDGCDKNGNCTAVKKLSDRPVSECARQLIKIDSCSDEKMLEKVFGGFDVVHVKKNDEGEYIPVKNGIEQTILREYGLLNKKNILDWREHRMVGVATEVFNQVLDALMIQCDNLDGRFMDVKFIDFGTYKTNNYCQVVVTENNVFGYKYGAGDEASKKSLADWYGVGSGENMCPSGYNGNVDVKSWGICSCWENGARRSKNGKSAKCQALIPWVSLSNGSVNESGDESACGSQFFEVKESGTDASTLWCTVDSANITDNGIVCSAGTEPQVSSESNKSIGCKVSGTNGEALVDLPVGK